MDVEYWSAFYAKQNAIQSPSLFAQYVAQRIATGSKRLIELGCGNGRDSVFFASQGHTVLAIDQCRSEIAHLSLQHEKIENIRFHAADFTSMSASEVFDIVYSRFTLHSVSAQQEEATLAWVSECLTPDGLLCIEVRGRDNELYGKGDPVPGEAHAFIHESHYRRFISADTLCSKLESLDMLIEYCAEKVGFAPFMNTNETFLRVIARKPSASD